MGRVGTLSVAAALFACADTKPTTIVLAISADTAVLASGKKLRVSASRAGTEAFSQDYALPNDAHLPATLTFEKRDDVSDNDVVLYRVEMRDETGATRVSRQARLGFVKEKSKLLRMPLSKKCLDIQCDATKTCNEGQCISDSVDPATLPDFDPGDPSLSAGGAAGAAGVAGTGGTGGTAGIGGQGGTAGTAGGGGSAGTGGAAGSGGTGGSPILGCETASVSATGPISLGSDFGCALVDGNVRCWGSNVASRFLSTDPLFNGFSAIPRQIPLSNPPISQVSVGGISHVCALDATQHVQCWGTNDSGELGSATIPYGLNTVPLAGVVEVAAGQTHTCARVDPTSGDNVYCWGGNTLGQIGLPPDSLVVGHPDPTQVMGASGIVELSTGRATTCGRTGAGSVYCWGGAAMVPGAIDIGVTGAAKIAVGGAQDDTVYFLDVNGGFNTIVRDSAGTWTTPTLVTPSGVAKIAVGNHLCTVASNLVDVNCKALVNTSLPTLNVTLPAQVREIAVGSDQNTTGVPFVCASLVDGSVRCWGDDGQGRLGIGYPAGVRSPTLVDLSALGSKKPVSVFLGGTSTIVQLDDLSVATWGTSAAMYGDNLTRPPTTYVSLPASESLSFAATPLETHTYVLGATTQKYLENGQPVALGGLYFSGPETLVHVSANDAMDLGSNGVDTLYSARDYGTQSPVSPPGTGINVVNHALPNVAFDEIGMGGFGFDDLERHACGRLGTAVQCWGSNDHGQVGQAVLASVWPPATVQLNGSDLQAESMCVGRYHSCATTPSGEVYCWGRNSTLQIVQDKAQLVGSYPAPVLVTTLAPPVKVSCTGWFTCAWTGSNVRCWGENDYGQLGDPSQPFAVASEVITDVSTLPPPGFTSIVDLKVGFDHACALVDGPSGRAVACWGDNGFGAIGTGSTRQISTPTQVCALDP